MLSKLTIRNYALIDTLDLEFGEGLTIITGETGAGKSIMLGALSLLLGGRADTRAISDGKAKSVVEAVFVDAPASLEPIFEENALDWIGGEVIIRREISATGRSRAFVNDVPVTLGVLTSISRNLIDIHSQHENARLNDVRAQLAIVDSVSDNATLREEYEREFNRFVALRGRIKSLRDEIEKNRENKEFLSFRLEALAALAPRRGELAEIEKRFEMLSDADEIRERLQTFSALLGAGERGAIDLIRAAKGEGEKLPFPLADRLEEIIIELQDIYETAEDYLAGVDTDPATLSKLSSRMNAYYDAVKRFKVNEADDLVDLREDIASKLDAIETGGEELPGLEKEGKALAKHLKELADRLTESRRKGAERFEAAVTEAARPLGLPNVVFRVAFDSGKLGLHGQDKVEFEASFNKNQEPGPVARMASGGEMSRLMLSIKGIMAGKMNLPTIIFDEVDTGVSGEIADKMGWMMRRMGEEMQVLTITHLPQVASKGDSHFKVFKRDEDTRTITRVTRLNDEERVREIAGMMSGEEVGEAALNNARDLLSKAAR